MAVYKHTPHEHAFCLLLLYFRNWDHLLINCTYDHLSNYIVTATTSLNWFRTVQKVHYIIMSPGNHLRCMKPASIQIYVMHEMWCAPEAACRKTMMAPFS